MKTEKAEKSKFQLCFSEFLSLPSSLLLCISNTNPSPIKSVLVSKLYRHSDKIRLDWRSGPDGSNDHFSNDKIVGGGGGWGGFISGSLLFALHDLLLPYLQQVEQNKYDLLRIICSKYQRCLWMLLGTSCGVL